MNQDWREKMRRTIQDWKNDPKIVRLAKMLGLCIITVTAYALAAHFGLGLTGLVLRVLCVLALLYILYQIHKSE